MFLLSLQSFTYLYLPNLFKLKDNIICMGDYKKIGALFFLTILFLSFVSAATPTYSSSFITDSVQKALNIFVEAVSPIFDALLGSYTGGYSNFTESEIFFIRVLLLIILFVFVYIGTKSVPKLGDNKGVVFIIAAAVSIIAVRFMSSTELFFGILLPYGTMGVAITTLVPFIIFFYFLHSTKAGTLGRRLGWLFFGIVFVSLWVTKADQLSETSNYIYTASAIALILVFVFDREIHRYFALHEVNIFLKKSSQKAVAALQAEYMTLIHVNSPESKARRDDIKTQLQSLGANLP